MRTLKVSNSGNRVRAAIAFLLSLALVTGLPLTPLTYAGFSGTETAYGAAAPSKAEAKAGQAVSAEAAAAPDNIIMSVTENGAGAAYNSRTIAWRSPSSVTRGAVYYCMGSSWTSGAAVSVSGIAVITPGALNGRYGDFNRFEATLTGLSSGTYSYRVGTKDNLSAPVTFTVKSSSEADARSEFIFIGDTQPRSGATVEDYGILGPMLSKVAAKHPNADLALQIGDIGNVGDSREEWAAFFTQTSPLLNRLPLLTAPGNHEFSPYFSVLGHTPKFYLSALALPKNGPAGYEEEFYSFDYGDVHIMSLSSNYLNPNEGFSANSASNAAINSRIKQWIRDDLNATDRKWRIVMLHHPAFPVLADITADKVEEQWLPVFEETGVDLLLCGHQHTIARTKMLRYGYEALSGGIVQIMGNSSQKCYASSGAPPYIDFIRQNTYGYHDIVVTSGGLSVTAFDAGGAKLESWHTDKSGVAGPRYRCGDLDLNGKIDMRDATLSRALALGMPVSALNIPAGDEDYVTDVNSDSALTMDDARLIKAAYIDPNGVRLPAAGTSAPAGMSAVKTAAARPDANKVSALAVPASATSAKPSVSPTAGSDENYYFVYAKGKNGGDGVLLRAISDTEMKTLIHGDPGFGNANYRFSLEDSLPSPVYGEGRGVTIDELFTHVNGTTASNFHGLTLAAIDSISANSTDAPAASVKLGTGKELLETPRYYFPDFYDSAIGWKSSWVTNDMKPDPNYAGNPGAAKYHSDGKDAVFGNRVKTAPLFTYAYDGDRVSRLSDKISANGGVTDRCLSLSALHTDRALRFVSPMSEQELRTGESTYSKSRHSIFSISVSPDAASRMPESAGACAAPNVLQAYDENTGGFTVTLSAVTPGSDIYYALSTDASVKAVNLKYSQPISINYSGSGTRPTLRAVAKKEGYMDSAELPIKLSTGPYYSVSGPNSVDKGGTYTYSIRLNDAENFRIAGAQAEWKIDSSRWQLVSASGLNGFSCGTLRNALSGQSLRFAYMSETSPPAILGANVKIGEVKLKPLASGTYTLGVTNALTLDAGANDRSDDSAPLKVTSADNPNISIYKLTFDAGKGKTPEKTAFVRSDGVYGRLPVPTLTGYSFAGWYDKAGGKGKKHAEGQPVSVTRDSALYAYWIPKKYKVSLNANGGSVKGGASIAVTYDAKYPGLPAAARVGYGFTGWYTAKSGGSKIESATLVKTASDHSLFARWEKVYKLIFNAGGGKVSPKNKEVMNGKPIGKLPTPTRKGYGFLGWFSAKSGGGKVTENTAVNLTKDRTVYARWGKKYTIKFNATGGKSSVKKKTVVKGKIYGKLPTPKRSGYSFKGWYTKKKGGSKISAAKTVKIKKTTTYYARWKKK